MVLERGSIIFLLIVTLRSNVDGKIYQRCELARELRNFDLPEDELPTWVCIARHESNFDTGAMNRGSGDHGLFQISEIYWCSPPGYGCNSPCSKFRDEDIADDLQCIRRIHNEHSRISGDGFDAWVVYPLHCKNITRDYIQDCFDDDNSLDYSTSNNEIPTDEDLDGDGYNFPALPINNEQDGDGYEFPKLPTRGQKALLPKFPANKNSIHYSVPVENKPKYDIRKFPGSQGSIHDSIPVASKTDIKTNPFFLSKAAKGSIYDSISVEELLSKTIRDNIKTNPFLNGKFSKTSSVSLESTSDNEIEVSTKAFAEYTRKEPFSGPEIPESIKVNPFLTGFLTTKPQISTTKNPGSKISSSTSYKINKSSVAFETTKLSSFFTRPPLSTTPGASISKTTPIGAFTTQKSSRGLFAGDSRHLDTSTTRAIYTTTLKPSTTTIRAKITSTTRKPSTTTLKPSTTTIRASTFAKLASTTKKPSTTTLKPSSTTIRTSTTNLFSKTSSKPFGSFSKTTFADLEGASSISIPYSTSPKPFSATAINPTARQVTFAPDSWFSWLFNSQTLPPLVGPPRPGSGPSLRPTPGGPTSLNYTTTRRPLPRPTPFQPGNFSTTRRPLQRPTHFQPGNFSTTRRPLQRPTHFQPGNFSTTRRPLPRPTAHLQPAVATSRRPPGLDRVTRRPLPHPPRRHPKHDEDGSYKEVPIDEHVVYLRSKYGFQLFRV